MTRNRAVALVLTSLLVACSSVESPTPLPTPTPTPGPPVFADLPPFPGSVAATDWVETAEPPPGMGIDDTVYQDLNAFLLDLRSLGRGSGLEVSVGLLGEAGTNRATAIIQVVNSGDDSVAGDEMVMELARGPTGWHFVSAQVRTHCHRGVDRAQNLCT